MTTPMWMVRAGEGGYLAEDFAKGLVAIGWEAIGDLSSLRTPEAIRTKYERVYPGEKPGRAANHVAVLYKFGFVLKSGHQVVTYDPASREYLVGEIAGDYAFHPGKLTDDYPHVRTVSWKRRVSRDRLSVTARNSLGSTLTLFSIDADVGRELSTTALPNAAKPVDALAEEREELEEIERDTSARARGLIEDKIDALDEEELPRLIAALLRAMRYRTRIGPKGRDRGVDILASPDGLGLEQPLIKVQVKHRSGKMDSEQVRMFLAVLRDGNCGLYVSSGGFTLDAKLEAERSTIPVTLIDLPELTTLVLAHYDNFDVEGRVLLPLVRIYWPAE